MSQSNLPSALTIVLTIAGPPGPEVIALLRFVCCSMVVN